MKRLFRIGCVCALFFILAIGRLCAENKSIIQVLDSLVIDLSKMDSTICIDNSVYLSFNSDSIFACEWIDMVTGDTISREKFVTLSPTTTHQYRVNLYYFTGELITGGDFEAGKNFYTQYKEGQKNWGTQWWKNPPISGWIPELWNAGTYKIGKTPNDYHVYFSNITDHTTGTGNMLLVNGSTTGDMIVWRNTVRNIQVGKIYAFSAWGSAIGRNNPAKFHFTINGKTLGVDKQLTDLKNVNNGIWEQFYELWEANGTSAEIALVNLETKGDGNDFAIDDISFASMEKKTGVITVQVLPSIGLGKLADVEACEGEEIRVNAEATGTGITEYIWTKDGNKLSTTSSLLQFGDSRPEDSGNYVCSVAGKCGVRQDTFRLDVREKLIVSRLNEVIHPCDTSTVVFAAGVEQGYRVTYAWKGPEKSRGWLGEKTSEYGKAKIHFEQDTGVYICQIKSQCGEENIYKTLEATSKIKITSWPEDVRLCEGTNLTLNVETTPEAREISWSHGGNILGHTSTLILERVSVEHQGVYTCVVKDKCNESDERQLILGVTPVISILGVSSDTAVCEHGKAVFRAYTDGKGVKYQWKGPGGFLANTPEITIESVVARKCGKYYVVATDSCGHIKTDSVSLSLREEYEGLQVTAPMEVCAKATIQLQVSERDGLTYDWFFPNGMRESGATISTEAVSGKYVCQVKGVCEPIQKEVWVDLKDSLRVESGETYFTLCPDESVTFQIEATGRNVRYEWCKAGRQLGDGKQWTLSNVQAEDAGVYECKVFSDCGNEVVNYQLEVKANLQLVDYSQGKYVRKGEKTTLLVNVAGDNERVYEWFLDGKLLQGENGHILEIKAPEQDTMLTYLCKISGCNVLEVEIPVYVRDYQNLWSDTTVYLCAGKDYSFRIKEMLDGECEHSETRAYWVLNNKDTVSRGNAITFHGFKGAMVGDYTGVLENDCKKETFHLYVDSLQMPHISAIRCDQGNWQGEKMVVCTGSEVRLVPEVNTTDLLIYEWRKDGVIIPGATEKVLVLPGVQLNQSGTYSCRVISPVCGEDVKEITLEVYKKLSIDYVPLVEKCPGESVVLKVTTDASVPSDFEWSGPGQNVWILEEDGYTANYKNAAVQEENNGVYYCKVINVCGEETAEIHLAVEKKLDISELVQKDSICAGETVTLSIPVNQQNMECLWILPDHRVIKQDTWVIEHFSEADTGIYSYQVQTPRQCFTVSEKINLHLRPELRFVSISPDTAVCEGGRVHFTALAEGSEVEYEWWGVQNVWKKAQSIDIADITDEACGEYEVVIKDLCNQIGFREKVSLSLLEEYNNLTITPDTGVCLESEVWLKVSGGNTDATYLWKFEEQQVGSDSVLYLPKIQSSQAGQYICQVSATCPAQEKKVNLNIYPSLKAWKVEFSQECVRSDVHLEAQAIGEQIRYIWYKNDREKGSRTNQLDLKDIIPADTGVYECRVNSLCGDSTLLYDVNLKKTTRIVQHSTDRVLSEGDQYKLSVEAVGENLSYSWVCNGNVLPEHESVVHRTADVCPDTLWYTCTVVGDCGVDSASIRVVVGEYRRFRHSMNDTLCEGSNYKYNVETIPVGTFEGQGFRYRWFFKGETFDKGDDPVFSLQEITEAQAGDYLCEISSLEGAGFEGCDTVKLHIEVIRLPQISDITDQVYAIEGTVDSIKLSVSGEALNYSWTKDGEATEHVEPDWYFKPIVYEDRGTYKVTVANQCSHVTAFSTVEVWRKTIVVYPPEISFSVCEKGDITLEVEAWGEDGLEYWWYFNGEKQNWPNASSLPLTRIKKEEEGEYLCVVSGRGGVDSCKIHLDVIGVPEVRIIGDTVLCNSQQNLLQVYAGVTNEDRVAFYWDVKNGEKLKGENWEELTVKWKGNADAVIALKVTSLTTNCSDSIAKPIRFRPLPEINLIVPDFVGYCQDSLVLNQVYPWGGSFKINGLPDQVVHITDRSIPYEVEYYYLDEDTGCDAIKRDTIHVADKPVVLLEQDSVHSGWCAAVELVVAEHSEGTIKWSGDRNIVYLDTLRVVYQATEYNEQSLNFQVALTDRYGCQATDTSRVFLLPSPKVELMQDTIIGICNDLVLKGECDVLLPTKVAWAPEKELSVLEEYSAQILENKIGDNLYYLSVTDKYGCVGKDSVWVTVRDLPHLESKEICFGDSLVIDVSGYNEFFWEDGFEKNNRAIKEPGVYELLVKDQYGCEGEATYQVHALPVVGLRDTLIYEGQKVEFVVEDNVDYPPYEVVWQNGSHRNSLVAENEGYYSVKIKDNIGCTASDTVFLTVKKWYIAAPDAFLPNSQQENARFYLKEVNFGSHFEMFIYDRWGELMFKTDEIGFKGGWDGSFKGIQCQPGAYVWVAFVDGKEVGRGTLLLVK